MTLTRAHIEYLAAAAIAAIVLALLIPAILNAWAAVRDDLRRADITNLKHALEMYNNQHVFYPTPPSGAEALREGGPVCTRNDDVNSWLFGVASPLLKEQHIDALPHDVRESRGRAYSYCVTNIQNSATAGYYLEAELEVEQPDTVDHDYDETRNFDYRVLHEGGKILYRVCGGTETQCTPPS